jgi:hypothetical protein
MTFPRAEEPSPALAESVTTRIWPNVELQWEDLGGRPPGLGAAGADRDRLDEALDAILQRPELGFTPDPPGREELAAMIERAW